MTKLLLVEYLRNMDLKDLMVCMTTNSIFFGKASFLHNNKDHGALDSILIECALCVYPDHKNAADNFLDSLDKVHTKHFRPFDKEKAIIASVVSVLKPGMSNTSSIAQDKWISNQTIDAVNDVRLLYHFLKDLLDLNEKTH